MNLFYVIACFCIVAVNAAPRKAGHGKGKCDIKKMDKCAVTVFVFGRRDVYLPTNSTDMVPHCQEEFDAEDCVKNYARKCLRPFPRQLVGVIMLGASQVIKNRCNPKGTKEYLSHHKCISDTIPELHDCMDQLVVSLDEIKRMTSEKRIPNACCAFSRYITCSVRPVKKQCKGDPTAEDYIANKMIRGYASEVLDLACQGYEAGSEKCNKITLPDGGFEERKGELFQIRNVTSRPYSLIPPFIDIFAQN